MRGILVRYRPVRDVRALGPHRASRASSCRGRSSAATSRCRRATSPSTSTTPPPRPSTRRPGTPPRSPRRRSAAACSTPSSPPSTTTATPCSTPGTSRLRRRALALRPRHHARIPRCHARRGHARRRLLLADRLASPGLPGVPQDDKPYDFSRRPAARRTSSGSASRTFMFAQVRELLTNYGQIDVIWFDGRWERTPEQWTRAGAGRDDPRTAAGHPDQRPPARRRRTTRRPSSSSPRSRRAARGRRA